MWEIAIAKTIFTRRPAILLAGLLVNILILLKTEIARGIVSSGNKRGFMPAHLLEIIVKNVMFDCAVNIRGGRHSNNTNWVKL